MGGRCSYSRGGNVHVDNQRIASRIFSSDHEGAGGFDVEINLIITIYMDELQIHQVSIIRKMLPNDVDIKH